jgi:hypothetical protein
MNQFNNKDLTKILNEPAALGLTHLPIWARISTTPCSLLLISTTCYTQPATHLMSFDLFTRISWTTELWIALEFSSGKTNVQPVSQTSLLFYQSAANLTLKVETHDHHVTWRAVLNEITYNIMGKLCRYELSTSFWLPMTSRDVTWW